MLVWTSFKHNGYPLYTLRLTHLSLKLNCKHFAIVKKCRFKYTHVSSTMCTITFLYNRIACSTIFISNTYLYHCLHFSKTLNILAKLKISKSSDESKNMQRCVFLTMSWVIYSKQGNDHKSLTHLYSQQYLIRKILSFQQKSVKEKLLNTKCSMYEIQRDHRLYTL